MKPRYRIQLGHSTARVSRYNQSLEFTIRDEPLEWIKAEAERLYQEIIHPKCQALIRARRKYHQTVNERVRAKAEEFAVETEGEWRYMHRISYGAYGISTVPWKNAKYGEFFFGNPTFVVATVKKSIDIRS